MLKIQTCRTTPSKHALHCIHRLKTKEKKAFLAIRLKGKLMEKEESWRNRHVRLWSSGMHVHACAWMGACVCVHACVHWVCVCAWVSALWVDSKLSRMLVVHICYDMRRHLGLGVETNPSGMFVLRRSIKKPTLWGLTHVLRKPVSRLWGWTRKQIFFNVWPQTWNACIFETWTI